MAKYVEKTLFCLLEYTVMGVPKNTADNSHVFRLSDQHWMCSLYRKSAYLLDVHTCSVRYVVAGFWAAILLRI